MKLVENPVKNDGSIVKVGDLFRNPYFCQKTLYVLPSLEALAKLVLPEGIFTYFELIRVEESPTSILFYLEEENLPPEEYGGDKLISKGFFEEIEVADFPIRGRKVLLRIKRHRWDNQTTGKVVFRNWELVAKGTRLTQEFAAFLKAISGQSPYRPEFRLMSNLFIFG